MQDYEFVFAKQLQEKLFRKVNGTVKTWVTDDTLHISCRNTDHNLSFELTVDNFAERILNGLTTDYLVYEYTTAFKAYVLRKFIFA